MYVASISTLSTPEKNLILTYLQLNEVDLSTKIDSLNAPCEQLVIDLLPQVTINDGTWQTLKSEYILWQIWREYNNPDFQEKAEKAKEDFFGIINIVRDNKHKQQVLAQQSDFTKTRGVKVFSDPII